jgi:hypothetical protein
MGTRAKRLLVPCGMDPTLACNSPGDQDQGRPTWSAPPAGTAGNGGDRDKSEEGAAAAAVLMDPTLACNVG